jgi:hypothetical protein
MPEATWTGSTCRCVGTSTGSSRRLTLDGMCDLAHAWWPDRLDPGWTPRPREESQAMLERLGLTGPFWQLE